jgi:hypothetical protein
LWKSILNICNILPFIVKFAYKLPKKDANRKKPWLFASQANLLVGGGDMVSVLLPLKSVFVA